MLCEADIKVSWRARPRGFVALMSLYESNYLRFLQLAGDPTRLSGTLISRVDGDCELQSRGARAHALYQHADADLPACRRVDSGRFERLPDLRLRAYHDARLLEAEQFRRNIEGTTRDGGTPGRGNVNCISVGLAT